MENHPTIAAAAPAGQGGADDPPRAVVLLSGGLDSATAAAWAKAEGYALSALSIAYGQRHAVELAAAREVAAALGITDQVVLEVDLAAFGGSALVDPAATVPKGRSDAEMASGIPATYVPARNTVFLSLALARLATKAGVERHGPRILAPLVSLSKAEIIRLGHSLGLDYGLTTSCYDPGPAGRPCGECDSCRLRAAGFAAAGLDDPRTVGWGTPRAGSG